MRAKYSRGRAAARMVLAAMAGSVIAVFCGPVVAHGAALPDGRRYELVSPADKHGGDVVPWSARTHASSDGNAIVFASLSAFAGAIGTGVTVDYFAERRAGAGGWVTHALTPKVGSGSINERGAGADTAFQLFSPDLTRGLLLATFPIGGDVGNVRDVGNLYLRPDVAMTGAGSYQLLTGCPACDQTQTPLPPVSGVGVILQQYLPHLTGESPDMRHVSFESLYDLTGDAPAQTSLCGDRSPSAFPPPSYAFCATRLYESDAGQVQLAGRVPVSPATECDDVNGPACVAADMSFAGDSARRLAYTPHVVSDGSDGHTRVMFTQPTAGDGRTFGQLDPIGQFFLVQGAASGNLFMRVDHAQTLQLNASERTVPDTFSPARYLDASANGERVFFMTSQALTDDATPGTAQVYMYDTATAPDHLTLVTPSSVGGAGGLLAVSDDGHYAYLEAGGRLLLWHDGTVHDIGQPPFLDSDSDYILADTNWSETPLETRVTPDGRHLLIATDQPPRLPGYDHGVCFSGFGCRELYLYSADDDTWQCASCNPTGARATTDASVNGFGATVHAELDLPIGGTLGVPYLNHALSDDGRYVFFNSVEALVPQAVNGKMNAYEYDSVSRRVSLLSTGTSDGTSVFLDASADGRDAFISTRDPLVGWDTDDAYDVYDARIDGGFPEPPAAPPTCSGGTCQGALSAPPAFAAPVSASFTGAGNEPGKLRARAKRLVCRRGFVKRTVKGNQKCVKVRARRARKARGASHRPRSAIRTRSGR